MADTKPEFSRPLTIEGIIPDKIRQETIEADEAECAALAQRFGIRQISYLKAKLAIRRVSGGTTVRVEGDIEADIVQACVVSLQDVHEHMQVRFETFFAEDVPDTDGNEIEFSPDDEDAPEMISNGVIDLGEVVAQYLSLDLNPYPRAPGVSLAAQLKESGGEVKNRPFAVLETLKEDKNK